MNASSADHRNAIESALLDYHRTPGRYALIRRQPALLFSSLKEVLQLASGRSPPGSETAGPAPAVRRAACFFVRSALLYPGADHYALLGLEHDADAAAIKDRYRLMMRLMHPDFSESRAGAGWPADAASRVNQAYEVLSSPDQRRAYGERLDAPVKQPAPRSTSRSIRVAPPQAQALGARRRLKQLATVFGVVGAFALVASLFAGASADRDPLVQREGAPAKRNASSPWALASASQEPPTEMPVAAPGSFDSPAPAAAALMLRVSQGRTPEAAAPPAATPQAPMMMASFESAMPAASGFGRPLARVDSPAPTASVPGAFMLTATAVPGPAQVIAQAPAPAPPPMPGVTLVEVHPLLSKLLQQMEGGWGDQVLGLLDREARATPAAQAFLNHYNSLVDGMRPIKLTHVQFKSQPLDGRLLVTGRVQIQVRGQPAGAPGRDLALQAEFASRDGVVVMTRLARAQE